MNVSANAKAWASVIVAVMGLIASGAIGFPPGIPEATQHVIVLWDVWLLTLFAAINGVLHWMPDAQIAPKPTLGGIVKALLFVAISFGLFALGAPQARAQTNGGVAGALVNSFKGTKPAKASAKAASTGATPSSPLASIKAFTVSDLQNAITLANAQTPPDTRHGQCWQAALPVAQAWQAPQIIPNQLGLATAVQTYFDAQASLTLAKLLPDNVVTACALTVSDLKISFAQLAAALGVSAVALPKLPIIP